MDCKTIVSIAVLAALVSPAFSETQQGHLPGTTLLTATEDLSERMGAGLIRYFERHTALSEEKRAAYWKPDFASPEAYEASLQPNRERLRKILGAVEPRVPVADLRVESTLTRSGLLGETDKLTMTAVSWPVVEGIVGEGILLQPKGEIIARVVVLPDADQSPEDLVVAHGSDDVIPVPPYARRLAEQGCQVLVPSLINRNCEFSGNATIDRYTNQPHREWIYRQAFTFGRHVIGYELLTIEAVVDWMASLNAQEDRALSIGVAGWGEGGLLAFYAGALDTRIDTTLVSGYFDRRERLWTEPVYRNLFGLLREFGDAEICQLIVPRRLIIEYSKSPNVEGPPPALVGVPARLGAAAAPGKITTPVFAEVNGEVERARRLCGPYQDRIHYVYRDSEKRGGHESDRTTGPMSDEALLAFLSPHREALAPLEAVTLPSPDPETILDRQRRQVTAMENHLQDWIDRSRAVRERYLWGQKPTTPEAWDEAMEPFRQAFVQDINGKVEEEPQPLRPQSRLLFDRPGWQAWEVTLNVVEPDLFVWGYLLLPKGMAPGEKRPVVVAQHGGGGVPQVVINEDPATNKVYKAYAVQMVEKGYIVFAPHFPWRTEDRFFRKAERLANPLGKTTFAVKIAQHRALLDWITAQEWADPQRLALYGLSWGGKVTMRIGAVEKRYALSICSGDFNEWIWKTATTRWSNSYLFVPEYETINFNLGMTFGHAEMAAMIAPRHFMVERGHDDGVGIDEWVGFEYARVNRLYNRLGIPERTRIEFFDGGHEINAKGTLEFLQEHFNWPEEKGEE